MHSRFTILLQRTYLGMMLLAIAALGSLSAAATPGFDIHAVERISGSVKDSAGEPLIGASVMIKGTGSGTVTDVDGSFVIDAPSTATLVITYTGYTTVEIPVGTQTNIMVVMQEDVLSLSEVVVVGYGSQRKENLTGAVGLVSAKELAARPITSASQALQGKVSGLWVNQDSGEPGEDGATIRIRGIGTLNNADPLILVDGIEAPFNNINPNDIESITVLKDAASASIYGSRAANGVVLVTTKRGRAGEKPTINYTGYYGVASPTNLPGMVTNSQQFMELRNIAEANLGLPAVYSQDLINTYGNIGPNTDWLNEVFSSSSIQQHNVSVSGGSAKTNFFISGGFLQQDSPLANVDGARRYNTRLNLDTDITDRFRVGTSIYVSQDTRNLDNIQQDGGVLARAIRQTPNYPAFLSDGSGRFAQREAGFPEFFSPNIFAEIASETRDETDNRLLASLFAEYEVLPQLKVRATVAANQQSFDRTFFNRRQDMFDWRTNEFIVSENQLRRLENYFEKRLNLTSWIQATYERSFQQNNFKFLVGFNQESFDQSFFGAARTQLPTNSLPAVSTGNPETATNYGGGSEWALRSFFGRINYDYDNKYLLEVNLRRDGSSRFGANNRWATFPSFSAGWVLSRESFLENSNFIDFLKIRASHGQLGNQNIGDFPFAALISFAPAYNFGGAIQGGAAQVTLPNPNVQWETTTQTDIGVNMAFLNGKLSVEADYFIRNTENILFNQPNPGVTGVREPTTRNIAEVRNVGWETGIRWNERKGDFSYGIGLNVTKVESEVIQLDPASSGDADRVIDGRFVLQRGSPINAIYGLGVLGIFQNQEEINSAPDQTAFGIPQPGDLRYEDFNGDGIINIDDRKVLGKDNPSWIYGLNLDLSYKGFDISAILQGVGSVETYGEGELFQPFNNSAGISTYWLDAWSPTNASTTIPRLATNGGIAANVTNEFWVQDRSYLRLRNVQIGYNFNPKLFANNFIESLRIYANGQNLWTSTNYLGFDPERAARDTDGGSGYPQLKIFTFGLDVRF